MNGELEKGFKPGEIFQLVKSINEKRKNNKIINVMETIISPDGTRAGMVRLTGGTRCFPEFGCFHDTLFKGDKLIEKIRGKQIELVFTFSFTPDGELLYGALLEDDWAVIVKGNTVIDRIQGKKFRGVENLFVLPDGKLAGSVGFRRGDGRHEVMGVRPFRGRTIIRKIGGKKITYGTITHVLKDGTLVGDASLKDERSVPGILPRSVPFKGNVLLDEIQGKKIVDTYIPSFSLLPDDTLVGVVELEDGRKVVFKGNALIEEIGGVKSPM